MSDVGEAPAQARMTGFSSKGSLSTHLKGRIVFSCGFFGCSVMRWMLALSPVVKTGFIFQPARWREQLSGASAPRDPKFNSWPQTFLRLRLLKPPPAITARISFITTVTPGFGRRMHGAGLAVFVPNGGVTVKRPKAAPHSRRFAKCEGVGQSRQRLECGGFSTALVRGVRISRDVF